MRRVVVAVLMAVVALTAVPASAFLTTAGTGAASALTASVPRPTQVTAAQVGEGIVHVTWSTGATPLPVSYRVDRISGAATVVACTTTAQSCDDVGVTPGTYSYRVVTIYRTWTAPSSPSPTVTTIDHLPTVTSFVRADPVATNLATVGWLLQFSEPVYGLTAANFTANSSGLTGAALTSISGSGTSWTLTASTGSGSGSLALSLTSSTGLTDSTGNPVAVPVDGGTYSIRPFFPATLTLADGNTNNRIGTGDSITMVFSATIDQSTLCSAWTATGDHSSTAATVTVVDGGSVNDSLAFSLSSCPVLHLGTISLGSNAYVASGSVTFAATLTVSDASHTIVIRLGTYSGAGTIAAVGNSPSAVYVPDPQLAGTSGAAAAWSVASTGQF